MDSCAESLNLGQCYFFDFGYLFFILLFSGLSLADLKGSERCKLPQGICLAGS